MAMNNNLYEISYSMRQERRRAARRAVLWTAVFFVVMNALLVFAICPVQQKSLSMEPNVPKETFVFSTPIGGRIKRGEIVIISADEETLPFRKKAADAAAAAFTLQKIHPFKKQRLLMRRAVALPGDTIYMKDFILYVQPKDERHFFTEFELNQVPYSVDITVPPTGWSPEIGARGSFDKITLGEGEYYVLGDNRLSCVDSRIFGKISGEQIQKRVLMNFFPFKRFRVFAFSK